MDNVRAMFTAALSCLYSAGIYPLAGTTIPATAKERRKGGEFVLRVT